MATRPAPGTAATGAGAAAVVATTTPPAPAKDPAPAPRSAATTAGKEYSSRLGILRLVLKPLYDQVADSLAVFSHQHAAGQDRLVLATAPGDVGKSLNFEYDKLQLHLWSIREFLEAEKRAVRRATWHHEHQELLSAAQRVVDEAATAGASFGRDAETVNGDVAERLVQARRRRLEQIRRIVMQGQPPLQESPTAANERDKLGFAAVAAPEAAAVRQAAVLHVADSPIGAWQGRTPAGLMEADLMPSTPLATAMTPTAFAVFPTVGDVTVQSADGNTRESLGSFGLGDLAASSSLAGQMPADFDGTSLAGSGDVDVGANLSGASTLGMPRALAGSTLGDGGASPMDVTGPQPVQTAVELGLRESSLSAPMEFPVASSAHTPGRNAAQPDDDPTSTYTSGTVPTEADATEWEMVE